MEEPHLRQFNVFDVGTNKQHIDYERIIKSMTTTLSRNIERLSETLTRMGENASSIGLAIPGHLLDMIADHDNGLMQRLANMTQQHNLKVLSLPYYAGSTRILPDKEFMKQVRLHNETAYLTLDVSPTVFFDTDSETTAQQLSLLAETDISSYVNRQILSGSSQNTKQDKSERVIDLAELSEQEITRLLETLAQSLEKNTENHDNPSLNIARKSIPIQEIMSRNDTMIKDTSETSQHRNELSPLQAHLIKELKEVYPHILSTGDMDLLTTWQYLSHHKMLTHVVAANQGDPNRQYENYMNVMNILNDIAHKIRSVKSCTKGTFIQEPEISESPSKLIAATLNNHDEQEQSYKSTNRGS